MWDTGPGIVADQREMVFEEFVQLQNPARDRAQGLGLGLAIVRRTAELLGHPLKLVSTPGRGSMFSITVPRATTAVPALPRGIARPAGESVGILVVEDETDVREAMVGLLVLEGHRVHAGASAEAARSAHVRALGAGAAPVDLIIADYRLGQDATGLEAVRALRAHLRRAVPAIIITGDTSPERLKEVSASGSRILHKPIGGDELRHAIQAALAEGTLASG